MRTVLLIIVLWCAMFQRAYGLEKDYQTKWCNERGGVMEVILQDNTRVDCVVGDYVVEFDFAYKWAEAMGQALHYAQMTGKKPKVVLIVDPGIKDVYHVLKFARTTIYHGLNIDVEIMVKDVPQ